MNDITPARAIVDRFGGLTVFCREMEPHVGRRLPTSTVFRWCKDGYVPGRYQPHVMAMAARLKVRLDPAEFAVAGGADRKKKAAAHAAQ